MVMSRMHRWGIAGVSICDNNHVLVFNLLDWFLLNLCILFFLRFVLLRIVSRRYLNDGIHNHVKIWLLLSSLFDKFLVDSVQGFGVDSLGQRCMFLCPVLEYRLEVGTYLIGLFEYLFGLLIQVKLYTVTHYHQVQYEALVFRLVIRVANHIFNQLQIVGDKFLLDVPIGFSDHVGQKNNLNLVE